MRSLGKYSLASATVCTRASMKRFTQADEKGALHVKSQTILRPAYGGGDEMNRPLVIGIGLGKTGTTSLHAALQMLGWNSIHRTRHAKKLVAKARELGQPILGQFKGVDAFTDQPFPMLYEEIDEQYPGSKFILTVRERKSWLRSRRKHAARPRSKMVFHPKESWERYLKHLEAVREHFAGRDCLLEMDICGGEGWAKLCPFLDVPIPDEMFPVKNVTPNKSRWN